MNVAADLFSAMPFFFAPMPTRFAVSKVVLALFVDIVDHRLVQCLWIALERQHIVGFAVHDLCRNRFLGAHRIDSDDRALDVHESQKLGNCRDFVRFLRAGDLAQRQAEVAGPNAHRVQRAKTFATIMTAPRGLAIDGEDRLVHRVAFFGGVGFGGRAQRLQPSGKARLKRFGFESGRTHEKC